MEVFVEILIITTTLIVIGVFGLALAVLFGLGD
jgi:hypothetical protein